MRTKQVPGPFGNCIHGRRANDSLAVMDHFDVNFWARQDLPGHRLEAMGQFRPRGAEEFPSRRDVEEN